MRNYLSGIQWRLLVVALAAGALVVACQGLASLPTAPSELVTGIAIYEHANFLGESAQITKDVSDLNDFKGPCVHSDGETTTLDWNDCLSSIRVAPGWKATIYRDPNFKGQSLELSGDVSNLQFVPGTCSHEGLNDCVSSIRVFPG